MQNAALSVLRTPSSFISSRMTADFTQRNSVSKEFDTANPSANTLTDNSGNFEKPNGSSDTFHQSNDNENDSYKNNNEHDQQSLMESNDNDHQSLDEPVSLNGNDNIQHSTEDKKTPQLSTSDRRKIFENRTLTAPESSNPDSADGTFESRKPRMSVAERLKMFQQNSAGSGAAEEDNGSSQANISHSVSSNANPKLTSMSSEDSSSGVDEESMESLPSKEREPRPAPITKPERKFSPMKQEPVQQTARKPEKVEPAPALAAVTKPPTSNKRIDTVFGKSDKFRVQLSYKYVKWFMVLEKAR